MNVILNDKDATIISTIHCHDHANSNKYVGYR